MKNLPKGYYSYYSYFTLIFSNINLLYWLLVKLANMGIGLLSESEKMHAIEKLVFLSSKIKIWW